MRKVDVKIGGFYYTKVSGKLVIVRIEVDRGVIWAPASSFRTHTRQKHAGFTAINLTTNREIRVTASRLRGEVPPPKPKRCRACDNCKAIAAAKPDAAARLALVGAEAAIVIRTEWSAFVNAHPCTSPQEPIERGPGHISPA